MPFVQTMIKCCSCGKLVDIYFEGDKRNEPPFAHVPGICNRFYTCVCPFCNTEIKLGNGCVSWVDSIPENGVTAQLHEE